MLFLFELEESFIPERPPSSPVKLLLLLLLLLVAVVVVVVCLLFDISEIVSEIIIVLHLVVFVSVYILWVGVVCVNTNTMKPRTTSPFQFHT